MMEELKEIAERWSLRHIQEALTANDADQRITVGLLGDFSSGKSTLLNELVGEPDLMAVGLEPCTTSAGLVLAVGGTPDVTCFRLLPDGELQEISRSELDDVARGVIPGRLIVHVPPTENFPDGLGLADTPGLGSLSKGHLETTLEELPYLDVAVICLDVEKGGLTSSIVDFLCSPGVRHLQHRFLVALTHADLKSPTAVAEVREATAKGLAEVLGANPEDAGLRVVATAAGEQAHKSGKADVSELRDAITRFVVDRRATIREERRQRNAARLIPEFRELLESRVAAMRAEGGEFDEKVDEVQASVDEVKRQRSDQQLRLDTLQEELRQEVGRTIDNARGELAAASTDDAVLHATQALTASIASTVSRCVGEFGERMGEHIPADFSSMWAHLKNVNRGAELGKSIATAVMAAAIMPNPANAGIAGKDLVQAGGGALARGAGKAGAEAAKNTAKQGLARRVLSEVFKVIDDVNPVNYAGDYLAQLYKHGSLDNHLPDLARNVAHDACRRLEKLFEEEYFETQEAMLAEMKEQLLQAERDRDLAQEDQRSRLRALDSDLARLTALALGSNQ